MTAKGTILTLLCYFNLAYAKPQQQDSLNSFWSDAKPGELLRSLDAITSTTHELIQPVQLEEINTHKSVLQRRIGEGSSESSEYKSPYDYDKAYDEFVKKYFNDSVTDALSASESAENVSNEQHDAQTNSGEELDSSETYEPISEASKKSANAEKCKRIVRGQQNCLICKDPRNGENSESCSYNKETKPIDYKFEKQKNYRKYRATPKISEEEDVTQDFSTAKSNVSFRKPIKRTGNKPNDTSSCTIKVFKTKDCYYCENSKGEKVTKCYAEELPKEQTKDGKKTLQKSHQRIYKRTISFSYENTPRNTNEANNQTNVLKKPLIQKPFLLKGISENER